MTKRDDGGPALQRIADAAQKLVDAVTFDDSGKNGRGGNGGLLSRETIRTADELRVELLRLAARNKED